MTPRRQKNPFLGCAAFGSRIRNLPLFASNCGAFAGERAGPPNVRVMFPARNQILELRQQDGAGRRDGGTSRARHSFNRDIAVA